MSTEGIKVVTTTPFRTRGPDSGFVWKTVVVARENGRPITRIVPGKVQDFEEAAKLIGSV